MTTTLGSNRVYQCCPKKERAREETIMNIYRKYFHDSLPSDKQYWTMCSGHTNEDGSFSYGSELGQLLRSNFISPEQFFGVDIVKDIIVKNDIALPTANWLYGDFVQVMKKQYKEDTFNPAIINADFISMNKKSSKVTSGILEFLSYIDCKDVMVIANVMYTNPYSGKRVALDKIDGDLLLEEYKKHAEFHYAWNKGWSIHPRVYSYEGTGENSNTIMSTLIFYRNPFQS